MLNFKNPRQTYPKNLSKSLFFYLALFTLVFYSVALANNHPCKNAGEHLRGDLGVVANRGGFWTLMEQNGLKEESMLGMQVDGKLARIVGKFEELCESKNKPSKQLFNDISKIVSEGRVIFNPRSSSKELLKLISKYKKDLDILIAKIK